MDSRAADEHAELRRIAARLMAGEAPGHTLRPTALAHEAWLRLRDRERADDADRPSMLAFAAWCMRRILIDHARRRRVRAVRHTTVTGKALAVDADEPVDESLLHLDDSLRELAAVDPELARIVELRFFAGATVEETARLLSLSARTVKRRWAFARAWLHNDLLERSGAR